MSTKIHANGYNSNCGGWSVAIIVAISILPTDGELSAEASDCQLGCALSFICSHAITISVRHLCASFEWLFSISLSVSGNSPSATPRLNHFAVRVEILSKTVLREQFSGGLQTINVSLSSQKTTVSAIQSCKPDPLLYISGLQDEANACVVQANYNRRYCI